MSFTNQSQGQNTSMSRKAEVVDSLNLLQQAASIHQAAFFAFKDISREYLRLRRENKMLKKQLDGRTRSLRGASAAAKDRLERLNALQAKSVRAKVKATRKGATKASKTPAKKPIKAAPKSQKKVAVSAR